jgi:hypothetical protein
VKYDIYIGEDKSYMEVMTHRWRAKIAAKKRNPFRSHQDLATLDLLLDAMLSLTRGSAPSLLYMWYMCLKTMQVHNGVASNQNMALHKEKAYHT